MSKGGGKNRVRWFGTVLLDRYTVGLPMTSEEEKPRIFSGSRNVECSTDCELSVELDSERRKIWTADKVGFFSQKHHKPSSVLLYSSHLYSLLTHDIEGRDFFTCAICSEIQSSD